MSGLIVMFTYSRITYEQAQRKRDEQIHDTGRTVYQRHILILDKLKYAEHNRNHNTR